MRSIKIKLGLLAVCNACVGGLMIVWGYGLGFRGRITLPVALLISVLVTQILAHGMTSPLREMTAAARAMARGDYRRRVRATSRDEVGELGRAFNRMAADLAEVEQHRREFVANVSHELRTPITALRAVLENVADGITPATSEVIEGALAQTERLGRLVTQLLDLSRVEAGAVSLDLACFEIGPFLEAAVADAKAAHPDPVFTVRAESGLTVHADRDRLHQVVANLLDNAARHSPPGGAVTVTAKPQADTLLLQVRDEGPGIPAEERGQVFERFSRGSASQVGSPGGGTGLGLAIARWAVDLHGGQIAVADSPTGCFIRVVLPQPPGGSS
ncbi:HAMP domain-containing sensor histidine kinase [Actinoallomurus oryzae]